MGRDRGSKSDPDVVKWILGAIERIKKEKQKPDLDRIINSIRETNSKTIGEEVIEEHLKLTVDQGLVEKKFQRGAFTFKVVSKSSPRKPPHTSSIDNCLLIKKETDLTEVVTLAIQALGEVGGSTLKNIERFITRNYDVDCEAGIELGALLRSTTKKAISRGKLSHEGRYYSVNTADDICTPKKTSAAAKCSSVGRSCDVEGAAPATPKASAPHWRYHVIVDDVEKAKVHSSKQFLRYYTIHFISKILLNLGNNALSTGIVSFGLSIYRDVCSYLSGTGG